MVYSHVSFSNEDLMELIKFQNVKELTGVNTPLCVKCHKLRSREVLEKKHFNKANSARSAVDL